MDDEHSEWHLALRSRGGIGDKQSVGSATTLSNCFGVFRTLAFDDLINSEYKLFRIDTPNKNTGASYRSKHGQKART